MQTRYIVEGKLNDGTFVSYGGDSRARILKILQNRSVHYPKIYKLKGNAFEEISTNELLTPYSFKEKPNGK